MSSLASRAAALDQREDARIGEIGDGEVRARGDELAASSVVVSPTTSSPGAQRRRATPDSESSKATEWAASAPSALKRGQIGQRVGLGAREFGADDAHAAGAPRGRARRAPARRWRAARW